MSKRRIFCLHDSKELFESKDAVQYLEAHALSFVFCEKPEDMEQEFHGDFELIVAREDFPGLTAFLEDVQKKEEEKIENQEKEQRCMVIVTRSAYKVASKANKGMGNTVWVDKYLDYPIASEIFLSAICSLLGVTREELRSAPPTDAKSILLGGFSSDEDAPFLASPDSLSMEKDEDITHSQDKRYEFLDSSKKKKLKNKSAGQKVELQEEEVPSKTGMSKTSFDTELDLGELGEREESVAFTNASIEAVKGKGVPKTKSSSKNAEKKDAASEADDLFSLDNLSLDMEGTHEENNTPKKETDELLIPPPIPSEKIEEELPPINIREVEITSPKDMPNVDEKASASKKSEQLEVKEKSDLGKSEKLKQPEETKKLKEVEEPSSPMSFFKKKSKKQKREVGKNSLELLKEDEKEDKAEPVPPPVRPSEKKSEKGSPSEGEVLNVEEETSSLSLPEAQKAKKKKLGLQKKEEEKLPVSQTSHTSTFSRDIQQMRREVQEPSISQYDPEKRKGYGGEAQQSKKISKLVEENRKLREEFRLEKDMLEDKIDYLEKKLEAAKALYEKLKRNVKKDIYSTREREQELELRLELLKKDFSSKVFEREKQVLNMRKQVNALKLELDNAREEKLRAKEYANRYAERISRAVKAVQLATGMLEEKNAPDLEIKAWDEEKTKLTKVATPTSYKKKTKGGHTARKATPTNVEEQAEGQQEPKLSEQELLEAEATTQIFPKEEDILKKSTPDPSSFNTGVEEEGTMMGAFSNIEEGQDQGESEDQHADFPDMEEEEEYKKAEGE